MNIIMFDDHLLFAKSIEILLKDYASSFNSYTSVNDSERIIKENTPDLVFMDIHLGDQNGLEVGEQLLKQFPTISLVFLSGYDLIEYHNQARSIGAKGFINKNTNPKEFIELLELIRDGKTAFPKVSSFETMELSEREKELLQLLAQGYSQQELAQELDISRRTVGNHIQAIHMKLDVSSTVSAIVKGIELGLIKLSNNR